ncbi:MAG: TonB-dependent receptor [Bacteroidetes bacterium]|nr:TonB-dependent receptor [Bacteroidota bacterium]
MRTPRCIRKHTLSFILLSLLTYASFGQAQTGRVGGAVLDSDTGDPLPGVEIYFPELFVGTVTAENGSFTVVGLTLGEHSLEARFIGFETAYLIVDIQDGISKKLTILLDPSLLEIQEILIEETSLIGGPVAIQTLPGSAHRLSHRALAKFRHSDVNRVLREVPGLNIIEEDGYGLRPNIGIRGTGAERSAKISLMEDGVLIAPAPYSAPAAYYFPTIGRMSGVEVRKGSSQIKYGPYTTGGAINLLSIEIPDSFSGRFHAMAGKDDNQILHASVGSGFRNGGFVLETYQAKTDGFKQLDSGGNTGYDKKDYLAKVRLNTNARAPIYQAIELKFSRTTETSNETYLGLTQTDFDRDPLRRYAGSRMDEMLATHEQWVLRYVVRPVAWLRISSFAYRNSFERNWYKLDKVRAGSSDESISISSLLSDPQEYAAEYEVITGISSSPNDVLNVKANNRAYLARGIQTSADVTYRVLGYEQQLELGLRIHYDEMDRFQWVDAFSMNDGIMELVQAGTPGTESNRIESAQAVSGFAQHRIQAGRFVMMPGLRYEHIDQERKDYGKSDPERNGSSLSRRENVVNVLIPGIGISYRATSLLTVFGGLHRGFSPPGSKKNTRPEKSLNYELGARINTGILHADATAFFHDFSNLLGLDLAVSGGGGTTDQFNGGEVYVSGVEFSLSYNLGHQTGWRFSIPITATYTVTSAVFQSDFVSSFEPWGTVSKGDRLPYLASHQATFGIGLEGRQFDVSFGVSYASSMRTLAGRGNPSPNDRTDEHFVVDFAGSYSIWKNTRVFASVRNLTDNVYIVARRPAGLRPGLPRTALFGISASF